MTSGPNSEADKIMKEFQEMVEAARVENSEISAQIETYAAAQAEMESFRAYLSLINETPNVVTANKAS
jgi:hypothetical protein